MTDPVLPNLVGACRVLAVKTDQVAIAYELEIRADGTFSLDQQHSGNFGITGTTWVGHVEQAQGQVVLQVEKEVDGSNTVVEDERSERISALQHQCPLKMLPDGVEVAAGKQVGVVRLQKVARTSP